MGCINVEAGADGFERRALTDFKPEDFIPMASGQWDQIVAALAAARKAGA